jgi:hypothetical protein
MEGLQLQCPLEAYCLSVAYLFKWHVRRLMLLLQILLLGYYISNDLFQVKGVSGELYSWFRECFSPRPELGEPAVSS